MRWQGRRQSRNVEDRRGSRPTGRIAGGIGVVVLALVAALFGIDPGVVLEQDAGPGRQPAPIPEGQEELRDFVGVVLASTEDVWNELLPAATNAPYREPRLVLFTDAVQSACGLAGAAVGPFYCPADGQVYIDLSFFEQLETQLGAPGDFAQAYVVAHEVGHHIQNLLGISDRVQAARRQVSAAEGNALSVRLELQADCLAGVWGHHADRAQRLLETGDVEEGLAAAAAIGDDQLQRQGSGRVRPETFTHGTSAQRVRWFRTGLETGDPNACDTFGDAGR